MHSQAIFFRERAAQRATDGAAKKKLDAAKPLFVQKRRLGMQSLEQDGLSFEKLRSASRDIRDLVLSNLDIWLELFEERALANGAEVLWARDGSEAAQLLVEIARRENVHKVVKSKSMLSEEADLNAVFSEAGIESIETDLGEYIVQLAKEPPSHIIAPAVHKSRDDVADLFQKVHGTPRKTDIPALAREAREVLRQHFLSADMGITGANFLVADTGSAILVTNEGNGRMVTTLPRLHVVITGIEKVVPTLDDVATLLRILPRSATGQAISNYVSVITPQLERTPGFGPTRTIFVLVDNGRSRLIGSEYQPMLRCIRCGACMNHCPVYYSVGGHAYGWVYPGPMGSVLTPLLTDLAAAADLPEATTGCGQCSAVCPVEIPLPEMMLALRRETRRQGMRPWRERLGYFVWAWVAQRPGLYRWLTRMMGRYLRWLAAGSNRIRVLGMAPGWTAGRDLVVSKTGTFHELYASRKRRQ